MQLALSVVGAVIGSFFGMPGLGFVIGGMVGTAASELLTPNDTGPQLQSNAVMNSCFGTPIPKVWGTILCQGLLIWSTDLKMNDDGGGGGGKGKPSSASSGSASASASFAIAFAQCEGTVLKLWADKSKLIYDATSHKGAVRSIGGKSTGGGGGAGNPAIKIYTGTEDQMPDPVMETYLGDGNVPAYRGLIYVVFHEYNLGAFGNRIPSISAEIATSATPAYLKTDYNLPVSIWGADNFVLDPLRHLAFYSYGGQYISRINLVTGEIEQTLDAGANGLPLGPYLGIDSDGMIYTSRQVSANCVGIQRIDPDSLTLDLASSYCANLGGYSDIIPGSNLVYGVLLQHSSSVDIFSRLDLLHIATIDVASIIGVATSVYDGQGCIGENDDFWAVGTNPTAAGSPSYLFRISGTDRSVSYWDLSAYIQSACFITFDSVTGCLLIGSTSDSKLIKWNPATQSVEGTLANMCSSNCHSSFKQGPGAGGVFYTRFNSIFNEIDTDSFTVTRTIDANALYSVGPAGFVYDDATNSILCGSAQGVYQIYLDRGTGNGASLALIVSDLCQMGQMSALDIDVTQLTDTVPGFGVFNQTDIRSALQPLATAYLFDSRIEDGKIKFIKRGGASVLTIPENDLAAHESGQESPEPLLIQRQSELEMPRQIEVEYLNADQQYENYQQYSRRLVAGTKQIATVDLTCMTLDHNYAKQLAEMLLFTAWTAINKTSLSLSRKYLRLSPADVVTVGCGGRSYRLRFEKVGYGIPGLLPCDAVVDNAQDYTSDAVGTDIGTYSEDIPYVGPTRLYLLDSCLLRDVDNDPGFYVAASGYTTGWPGCVLYKSTDGGASWAPIATITIAAVCGSALTALASGPTEIFDEGNTVDVQILNGESLSSTSKLNVLNGANAALLGSDGRWELIQFKTATLVAGGQYRLSGLLRGRRGTGWACSTHQAGDKFILLSASTIRRITPATSEIGLARKYKAVTIGSTLDSARSIDFTDSGSGLKPYALVHIKGARDGAGNLTISWIRRTRIGGGWADYVDVSLGESSEAYEIDILDGTGAVKRTISGLTTPTAAYSAADQTTDFGAPQGSVHVKIYQLSAIVGRGYAGDAII